MAITHHSCLELTTLAGSAEAEQSDAFRTLQRKIHCLRGGSGDTSRSRVDARLGPRVDRAGGADHAAPLGEELRTVALVVVRMARSVLVALSIDGGRTGSVGTVGTTSTGRVTEEHALEHLKYR